MAAGGKEEKRVEEAGQLKPTPSATAALKPTEDGEAKRPRRGRRKARILAVEYTLLGGVNDSLEDADRLADWLRGVNCVVNLITFNAHEGTPFSSSSLRVSEAFRQALTARGQLCTFRDSRGDDGMAACGWVCCRGLRSVDHKRDVLNNIVLLLGLVFVGVDATANTGSISCEFLSQLTRKRLSDGPVGFLRMQPTS